MNGRFVSVVRWRAHTPPCSRSSAGSSGRRWVFACAARLFLGCARARPSRCRHANKSARGCASEFTSMAIAAEMNPKPGPRACCCAVLGFIVPWAAADRACAPPVDGGKRRAHARAHDSACPGRGVQLGGFVSIDHPGPASKSRVGGQDHPWAVMRRRPPPRSGLPLLFAST